MPRNSDGVYGLPGGTLVSIGDTLLVTQHNPPMQDIAAALTDSLSRSGNGGMQADLAMGTNKITGLAPGTNPTDAATVGQLASGSGVPVGCVMDFAGSSAPDGWLICAGQSLSRTDYAALFDVIGTTFGSASGSTFNLPDCRGRATAGLDVDSGGYADRLTTPNSRNIGAAGGTQTVAITTDQMPSHEHTLSGSTSSAGTHSHSIGGSLPPGGNLGFAKDTGVNSPGVTGSDGAHTHTLSGTAAATGGGQAHSNVQPVIVFQKIIKASAS